MRPRRHQLEVDALCRAVACGEADVADILASVTPGGGKSSLPVIAAARLLGAVPPGYSTPIAERVCWVVPRDSLRRQAEEAFVDPRWRGYLGHDHAVRAADNGADPCRGLSGYVTTYQAVAAAPGLHLEEFRRHRYLLCVDELHHLPGLAALDASAPEDEEEAAWSRALLPLFETAGARLLMTGTLERADGRPILGLPYRASSRLSHRRRVVNTKAPGWGFVAYDRRAALAERAILPIRFGALDGNAAWREGEEEFEVRSFRAVEDKLRPMLHTALRTGYAEDLLKRAFRDCRAWRAERRREMGLAPGTPARGLGKLLVVAPDQKTARGYLDLVRGWTGGEPGEGETETAPAALAISDEPRAVERIARFRLLPEPSVLVTVGMAYEGLDAPEISHVACLTHIRSVPWLEQMAARAVRLDPNGPDYDRQEAVIYHPDDPLFGRFRTAVEEDQAGSARLKIRKAQRELPFAPPENLPEREGVVPLRSSATDLRFEVVCPAAFAPDDAFGDDGPAPGPAVPRPIGLIDTPAQVELRLRRRLARAIAEQVVADEGPSGAEPWRFHAYNAVLKRVTGKARGEMTLKELRAALAWLDGNRLAANLDRLEGDARYRHAARDRRAGELRRLARGLRAGAAG